MSRPFPLRWLTAPVLGWREVGVGDIGLALVLSTAAVASASGLTNPSNRHSSVGASLAVLLMTAPVLLARRRPVLAAGALAAGAALNWAVFGHLVRCGAALPAVFYVAFMIGSRSAGWRRVALGMGLLVVNLFCQAWSDPQLGPGVVTYMVPISVGFMVAGRLLRGRNAMVASLRDRTAELREQREHNAKLAVAADQARIAGDLDWFLHDRVGRMAAAASSGQAMLAADPSQAQAAFAAIQETGRETLNHMRGVVSQLRDQVSTEPQPVLAELDRLLGQTSQADAYLQVRGDPRLLPPGVELSGYRIVEHLLVALDDVPAARIDVAVTFGPDSLELTVAGPSVRHRDVRPALAAATERAALLGGTLRSAVGGGRRETVVLLPLAAWHA